MSGKVKDLCGRTFGQLKVIKMDCIKKSGAYWVCHCDCNRSENFSVRGVVCYGVTLLPAKNAGEKKQENFILKI